MLTDSSSGDSVRSGALTIDPNASANFVAAQKVFRAQCAQCHVAFSLYTENEWLSSGYVVAGSPDKSSVFSRIRGSGVGGAENMPPSVTLTAAERDSIKSWITGIKTTSQPATGAAARFSKAMGALGRASCLSCHASTVTASSSAYGGATVPAFGPFTTESAFVTSGLVVPGNPNVSWLYRALRTYGDIGVMPNGTSSSIPAQDAAYLSDWITNIGNP